MKKVKKTKIQKVKVMVLSGIINSFMALNEYKNFD